MTDCTMDNVSSSPIFIRIGDKGRYPVTGHTTDEEVNISEDFTTTVENLDAGGLEIEEVIINGPVWIIRIAGIPLKRLLPA